MNFPDFRHREADPTDALHDHMDEIKKHIAKMTSQHGMPDLLGQGPSNEQQVKDVVKNSFGLDPKDIKAIVKNLLFPKKQCAVNDDECESRQKEAIFGTKYKNATKNYKRAKGELDALIKSKENTAGYRKALIKQETLASEINAMELLEKHKELKNSIQEKIDLIDTQEMYDNQTKSIIDDYAIGTLDLEKNIQDMENKNTINNRKAYYEVQQIDGYKYINSYLSWTYWIVLVLLICIELYKYSQGTLTGSMHYRALYSILMIFYPFIMDYIIQGTMYVLNILFGKIPDNIYMNI